MFLGLRTIIYSVEDLDRAKEWYASALGFGPYFEEPFYVGFNVGGFELGLLPQEDEAPDNGAGGGTYWGVEDADTALRKLLDSGAAEREGVADVGDGIRVASVTDPFGNVVGIIENPNFSLDA